MLAFSLFSLCFVLGLIYGAVGHSISVKPEANKHSKNEIIENNYESLPDDKLKAKSVKIFMQSNSINDTGLAFGTYYYLKDRTGLYIRWDGKNVTSSPNIYGLTSDSRNSTIDDDWYLFVIEPYGSSNDVVIKNVKTGQYITHDWCCTYYLRNLNSSSYPIRLRLILRDNNLINIQSADQSYPYYLSYLSTTSGSSYSYLPAILSISSTSVAYLSFIPESHLYARINNFTYEAIDSETVQAHLNQVNLISPTYITNTSPSKITHEIFNKKSISESIEWRFDQNLNPFANVSISKELPKIITRNGGFEKFESIIELKSSTDKNSREIVNENEYIVKKTVEIPPNSSVKIQSFVDEIEDLRLRFTAIAVITGDNDKGYLSGEQIESIIGVGNFTIVQVNKFSVYIEVSGVLGAKFVLNNQFIVNNIDSIENESFDLY